MNALDAAIASKSFRRLVAARLTGFDPISFPVPVAAPEHPCDWPGANIFPLHSLTQQAVAGRLEKVRPIVAEIEPLGPREPPLSRADFAANQSAVSDVPRDSCPSPRTDRREGQCGQGYQDERHNAPAPKIAGESSQQARFPPAQFSSGLAGLSHERTLETHRAVRVSLLFFPDTGKSIRLPSLAPPNIRRQIPSCAAQPCASRSVESSVLPALAVLGAKRRNPATG